MTLSRLSRFGLFSQVHCQDDEIGKLLSDDIEFFKSFFSLDQKKSYEEIEEFFFSFIKKQENISYTAIINLLKFFFIIRPLQFKIMQKLLISVIKYFQPFQQEIHDFIRQEFSYYLFNVVVDLFDQKTHSFKDLNNSKIINKRTFFENSSFFSFLQNDEIDEFIEFLTNNPNVDIYADHKIPLNSYMSCLPEFMGQTIKLIDFCCFFGSVKCFKYFVMNNCPFSSGTSQKYAVAGGSYEIVQIINQHNFTFKNCLEESIKYHRYELMDWIIMNFDTEPVLPTKCLNYYNYEAFLFDMNNQFYVKNIIENIEQIVNGVNQELHVACREGQMHIVRYLIENEHFDPNLKGYDGNSPLYYACTRGHLNIVKYLIEKANVNKDQVDNVGNTPFLEAVISGQLDIVKYLVEEAHVDKNATGFCARTALHYACTGTNLSLVKYLIEEAQLDKNSKDLYGFMPIYFAIKNGILPIVQYLIEEAGVDKNSKNEEGDTLLHYSCQFEFLPIVKYLVDKNNVDVNTKNEFGCTPLHFAASSLNYEIIRFLISKGADKHVTDMCGKTPYDDALSASNQYGKNIKLIEFLK